MQQRVFGAVLCVCLTGLAVAQSLNTGTLIGTATDPSGAVVPGAQITMTDSATGQSRSVVTNSSGQYSFPGVPPGTYSVKATHPGFSEVVVPRLVIEIGRSYTVNLQLQVGTSQQVVEVTATPGAELQTLDASVGSVVGGDTLLLVPTLTRNVASLLLLQPTSLPQNSSTQGSDLGGQVAGAHSDQNSIVLDGGNATDGTSGNNDYFNSSHFDGGPEAGIPTPVESIQEFRVSTSNHTASFSGASGSETILVTKRGSNEFHGSAYWYLQNSDLNANTWTANRLDQARPQSRDNRFGASLGGYIPGLKDSAKTYFYMNYEGRRLVANQEFSRTVPTDTLRQGILRFRDASGNIISYNLATAELCGAQGNSACDPRGLGINPLISQLWNKYEPEGNDPSQGDGLNTTGFTAPLALPTTSNFGVVRLDHSFGSKWQAFGSYRIYKEVSSVPSQVDIGGLVRGDVLGQPAAVANQPRQPRYLVFGLTGTLSPNLTNELNVSYLREFWYWNTASVFPQVPGTSAALLLGGTGASATALLPVNFNTTSARQRLWDGHNYNLADNISWLKGTHFIRAGGTFSHSGVSFFRDDGQTGQIEPEYLIQQSAGLNIPAAYQPRVCAGSLTSACIPSNQLSNWNSLYSQTLGLVDEGLQVRVRDGQLNALPPSTVLFNYVKYDSFSLYATDSWKITPTLTVNYGVNWSVDIPPVDQTGKQSISMIAPSNSVLIPQNYLAAREQAALNGQVYNPTVEFGGLGFAGRTYPYNIVWNTVAPRAAVAWTPKFGGGHTVIRGGFGEFFDRLNGVQKVGNEFQSFGFQQTPACVGPSRTGQCLGSLGSDPLTGFRIGVDGPNVPIPAITQTATAPLIPGTVPGANQPIANTTYQIAPNYTPGRNEQWDLTIQREMPGKSLLEVGYIGRHESNMYNPLEINGVPWMMTLGGQSYAQAYDAIAAELAAGSAVTPQPFLETALKGSALCAAPNASCTAGVVGKYSSSFRNQQVLTVWNGIQPSFSFGPATAQPTQVNSTFFYWSSAGWANYNAGFISYHTRNYAGLTLDANFTLAHSLDTGGLNQDFDTAAPFSYNLGYSYGTSVFDRKAVLNLLVLYELPFGKNGHGPVRYMIRGWSIAPVFTVASGLPLKVLDGSGQEFGQDGGAASAGAVLIAKDNFGNSVHAGVAGDAKSQVGINSNSATGGTGLNLFANPLTVFQSFRPVMVGVDTSSGGGGQLRGLPQWNLDLALNRTFRFTERWSATFSAQMFNAFNHVVFANPSVSLQSPQSFGVLTSQLNSPRIVQLGLHIDF